MIKLGSMSGQPLRQVASSCAEEIEQQNHADPGFVLFRAVTSADIK